ncbi:MAG: RICIN domain-containing protein [Holophaga sp.]|nr:RICIN domain-containing protein [Holophaga sp.]
MSPWLHPLAALLVAALLGARPAAAEPVAASTLRAKVNQAVLAKWSPEVRFHPSERYFPSTAEELFLGAKAFRVGAKETDRIGPPRPIRTPADLARLGPDWRIEYDPANPKVKGGDVTGTRPNLVVTAPMYVSVQIPGDASYVNLRYNFLFGYNGAQSMRSFIGGFNYTMQTMAEHEGDWEGVDIQLTPDLASVIQVKTEAHGDQHRYLPGDLDWTGDTHIQLRLALNSHGVYNGKGKNPEDWIVLEDLKAAAVVDIISRDGPVWRPWTLPDSFRVFGKVNGRLVGKEAWTLYQGRLGTHKTNSASAAVDITGEPFSDFKRRATATTQRTIFKAVSPFLRKLFNGMPCEGVGKRSELQGDLPALPSLARQKKYLVYSRVPGDLVLSVNPKAPDGGLIVDTLRPGDVSQLWYLAEYKDEHGTVERVGLVNVQSGKAAGAGAGNGGPVTLWHRTIVDDHTQWTLTGSRASNCAIRPAYSHAQNLNVLGNGPYKPGNPVGTWTWSRGAGNETWRLVEAP